MIQTNYIAETDNLEICFKECNTPIVKQMSNGVDFEFDNDYHLARIILPNFCKMIRRQYSPNTIFQYDHTIFDKNHAIIIIQVNNQPIKVKIDLSKLEI